MPRHWRSPDGIEWVVDVDLPGSSNAMVTFRHFMSWKPLFYDGLLPALRVLGPSRGDAILGAFGTLLASWPPRRRELLRALSTVHKYVTGNTAIFEIGVPHIQYDTRVSVFRIRYGVFHDGDRIELGSILLRFQARAAGGK